MQLCNPIPQTFAFEVTTIKLETGGVMFNSSIRAAVIASLTLAAGGLTFAADTPKTLPLDSAIEAAQAALASCKSNGYNVTVMVMDPDYATRLVLRSDAAAARTVEIARRKAYTVIKTGMSSGDFGKSVPKPETPAQPRPPGSPPPGVNGDDNLITFAGGKQIKMGGEVVGAMSVSGAPGGDKDEACVDVGLSKIKK
jgi:uncharacterized protein GlcG (DUF336 family)